MNTHTTVTPYVGFYHVTTVDRWGIQAHQVGKDKRCTCGGTRKHPCRHIRAVTSYLKAGGERAPEHCPVREKGPLSGPPVVFTTCPICDASIAHEGCGRWRCPNDASHYFQWRGELNDGAIRKFLTRSHPNKIGAFYSQTAQEREASLSQAARRTHGGRYTPYV